MKVSRFMARQYSNPSGLFGRFVVGRLLDRANTESNRLVFECLDIQPDSSVLEVGFGGGELLERIADQAVSGAVHGVEISSVMVDRAENKFSISRYAGRVSLHRGSVDTLPFPDQRFDRVCSVNTVYFWSDLARSLSELARITRPRGLLVLGFGSRNALRLAGYDDQGYHLYSSGEIQATLAQVGFQHLDTKSIPRPGRGTFYVVISHRIEK